jgi:hypothetical protein
MSKRKGIVGLLAWCLGALVIGAVIGRHDLRQWVWLRLKGQPALECPSLVDVGELELGNVGMASLTISNAGGGQLIIDSIETNCTCAGLERQIDGDFLRVKTLKLGPSERADMVVRVSARGKPQQATKNLIRFRTNDPARPEAAIEIIIPRITGATTTVPASVVLGNVTAGTKPVHVVEIRDSAVRPRKVTNVASSNPDRVSARLLAPPEGPADQRYNDLGTLIARVEVAVQSSAPGPIEALVSVYLDEAGREPDTFRVSGRAVGIVDVLPSIVVLPRFSDGGPLFTARCICLSESGAPLEILPTKIPVELAVRVSPADATRTRQVLEFEWKADKRRQISDTVVRTAEFRARSNDREATFEISVTLLPTHASISCQPTASPE